MLLMLHIQVIWNNTVFFLYGTLYGTLALRYVVLLLHNMILTLCSDV